MDSLFDVSLAKNCLKEKVWIYDLSRPVDRDFEQFIACFGKLKYPLGEGYSFIKLDVPRKMLLTGNIGSKELRLTIKYNSDATNIKELFEVQLTDYLKGGKNAG